MAAMDLNDLRVFEKVGALLSFSAAARALGLPKSSVSRGVARLEAALGVRLCQRTTREVVLTEAGAALLHRCAEIMGRIAETVDYVGGLAGAPRGMLRVSAGIGFGVNILSGLLPEFRRRYPDVSVTLDLSSRLSDLVADGVDVAVRMGPMPSSSIVAVKLGSLSRHLCASPVYLARRGTPGSLLDVTDHDTLEMPGPEGRARRWRFQRGAEVAIIEVNPQLCVNDALTLHRMILAGAGVGVSSGYLCAPEIAAGRLVRLFPDWSLDPVEVHLAFPSGRDLSPAARAFVDFMKQASKPGAPWRDDLATTA